MVQSNPHVDVFQLRLNQFDQADMASILLKEAPSNGNNTIKYYTAPLEGAGVQFASTKPKAKQWADEGWEESQTTNAMQHLGSRDTEERVPVYAFASSIGLEWYRDVKDLCLPTYIASPVSCAISFPLAWNKLHVTPFDLVVTAPAQAPINHNLKDLRRTEHAHLLNCPTLVNHHIVLPGKTHLAVYNFTTLAMVEMLDLEQRSVLETNFVGILNQKPPFPGRPSDSPQRETVYGVLLNGKHAPSPGQPMRDLPALATWGKFMTTLIAQII